MALSPGTRLGPYEVVTMIGSGGMGEVYRAKDTRLERTIAIKVLPGNLSSDTENKKRFEREVRSISSLSHPHICAVHDVGHQNGTDFLVMEFLEGETLTERLAKGALPLDQVLRFGAEIADALDHAHRNGIIHRDLKPGNIILGKSGVKLLDFGLAKIATNRPEINVLELPTQQHNLTAKGYILGTIQYMSPEQLEGKEVDTRTDIFSLGTMLYEMATGQKPFTGNSPATIISSILSTTPAPLEKVRSGIPDSLDRIVQTCLAKNPEDRWQIAHDVALQLRSMMEGITPSGKSLARLPSKWKIEIAWALGALFLITSLILGGAWYRSSRSLQIEKASEVQQLSIVLPYNNVLNSVAISPDGKRLAYVTNGTTGFSKLWLRTLDSTQAEEIPGTDNAAQPFWAPDGQSIAFFTERELKKLTIGAGPPEVVSDVTIPRGGSWNQYGDILFSPKGSSGLYRVPARGGEAKEVTRLNQSRKEGRHAFPQFLPDGRHFLFLIYSTDLAHQGLYLGSLDSQETKRIFPEAAPFRYLDSGHLFFVRNKKLMVQPFNPEKMELMGEAIPLADNSSTTSSGPIFAASNNLLVYGNNYGWFTQPMWFDRSGRQSGPFPNSTALGEPGAYFFCDLSSDNRRLLTERNGVLWIIDLLKGSSVRYAMTNEKIGVFSPDGSYVAYSSYLPGGLSSGGLYMRPSNGTGKEELLVDLDSVSSIANLFWSANGEYLSFTAFNPKTNFDLWVLPLKGEGKPFPYLATTAREESNVFSPDGNWVAYQSYQSGRAEIYVRGFPAEAKGVWAISTEGGEQPFWRRDGKELFYLTLDKKLMAMEVQTGEVFKPGNARVLFQTQVEPRIIGRIGVTKQYFPSSDGNYFLMNALLDSKDPAEIHVLVNWKSLLK